MQSDGGILYSQIKEQLPKFIPTNYPKFATFIEKYYEFLELNLLTFTDLDLNEDKPLQETANVTYTVTVATGNNAFSDEENKYYINDEVSPTLTLTPGVRYFFDLQDPTLVSHGFRFSKTPDGTHTPSGSDYTTDDRGDVLITYSTELDNILIQQILMIIILILRIRFDKEINFLVEKLLLVLILVRKGLYEENILLLKSMLKKQTMVHFKLVKQFLEPIPE